MTPIHRTRQSGNAVKATRCLPRVKCLSTNLCSCTTVAFTCVFM